MPMKRSSTVMEDELMAHCRSGGYGEAAELLNRGADACSQDEAGKSPLMNAAASGNAELVQLLLEKGAPWNAIDKEGRCAGEYAIEGAHEDVMNALLEAGVRAELLLGAIERKAGRADELAESAAYLQNPLHYGKGGDGSDVLLDEQQAVMMEWERPLMQAHAQVVCTGKGDVLNVGFGLGIVDEAIQALQPKSHTIIEAHPDVHAQMIEKGWDKKPGVRIIFGRWQDSLKDLQQYDGIFFDTYSEFYEDLRKFQSHLPQLLRQGGLYSYFNGLAADNPFFYLVYSELCKLELSRLGLETQYISLPINVSDKDIWRRVGNRYWQLDTYLLPVAEWQS